MPDFKVDDSLITTDEGRKRVEAALKRLGGGIVTSRDEGLNDVLFSLKRDANLPPGFDQWQLPVKLGGDGKSTLFFLSVVQPGAIVPTHSHARDLFRLVVSGSIILGDGRVLQAGDWMYVPAKTPYSFRGGVNPGAVVYHCY